MKTKQKLIELFLSQDESNLAIAWQIAVNRLNLNELAEVIGEVDKDLTRQIDAVDVFKQDALSKYLEMQKKINSFTTFLEKEAKLVGEIFYSELISKVYEAKTNQN